MPKMTSKQAERAARKLAPQAREAFLALLALHREQVAAGLSKYRRWESALQYLATDGEVAVPELWDHIREQRAAFPAEVAQVTEARAKEEDQAAWEGQAFSIPDPLTDHQRRKLQGKLVWTYHGTSDALLPSIQRDGLKIRPPKKTFRETTSGWVYIATTYSEVLFYTTIAVSVHGGNPVILGAIVPFDHLHKDLDDKDLDSGRRQFRVPFDVKPEQFFSLWRGGEEERLRGPLRHDEEWRRGFVGPDEVKHRE